MIGIVDYGMGNLLSVYSAFDYLGEEVKICVHPEDLSDADRIVIPGVGAFRNCIERLKISGFVDALGEHVIKQAKPTLGICLGMQVMAQRSFEGGEFKGLGWFDADVVRIPTNGYDIRVPNIGWNEIKFNQQSALFKRIPQEADFYLVHSFYMKCRQEEDVLATYQYGGNVTAAVVKDNVFATQFHPEKSQDYGLKILENFIAWKP